MTSQMDGTTSATAPKQLHLLSDPGFKFSVVGNMVVMSAVMLATYTHEPAWYFVMDSYEQIKLEMQKTAHHMAWWSLIGLLSSSCCVIQILLNMLGLGCAGFNTFLGPIRPTFIAAAVLAQACSWWVAYPRPWQWVPTATATAVSALLTFSPELLAAYSSHQASTPSTSTSTSTSNGSACDGTGGMGAKQACSNGFPVKLQLESDKIGCISCLTTIRKVLSECKLVLTSTATIDGVVTAQLTNPTHGVAEIDITNQVLSCLEEAGFSGAVTTGSSGGGGGGGASSSSDVNGAGCVDSNCSSSGGNIGGGSSGGSSGMWSWLWAVGSGLLGSSCCLLQLALNMLSAFNIAHIGCAGFNKVLGPFRPQLRLLTATWIAVAWGNELRRASTAATPADSTRTSTGSGSKRNNTKCNTTSNNNNINNSGGGGSSSSSDQHTHRTRLARATLVCCFLTFLPEVLLYMGSRAIAPPANGAELIPLVVEGMGCEACQLKVQRVLERSSGVLTASVDYKAGKAAVLVAKEWSFDVDVLNAELMVDGFSLRTLTLREKQLADATGSASATAESAVEVAMSPDAVRELAVLCAALVKQGRERMQDPAATQPSYWDEDEDGVWEHPTIPNPEFEPCTGA